MSTGSPILPPNADAKGRMVMLTYGRMQDGKGSYWCYVAVKPSQYQRFQSTLKAGALDLQRFEENGFGEVIVSGPGLYPPPEVTRDVGKTFNTPIKDLFGNLDAETVMAQKIAQLKGDKPSSGNTGA